MSERVSNKTAEEHLRLLEASEVKYEGILPGSCPHIDALRDLLDSRARVDALMFNEEISQDVLEQSEASAKAWEEDALLRAKNEVFWRDRAERAEARVKELETFVVWLFGEWCPGGDIDGGMLQEEMERRGLIVPHVVTADESDEAGDFCEWEEGETIYILTPDLEALRGEEK